MEWRGVVVAEFSRLNRAADPGVVEEMAQHAEAAFASARAEGATATEAEASVRALVRSWCDGTTGPRRIERPALVEAAAAGRSACSGLPLDLRLAFRLLRRQPGFAFVSIAMIALAIAATTSIFSVINSVLLKPLPGVKAGRLVRVFETGVERSFTSPLVTNLTYHAWADDRPQTIDGLGGWSDVSMALDGPSGIELVRVARVTASLFPLLGVAPALGVAFTDADELSDDRVILSFGFWQERFGGKPDALGRRLTVAGRPRTIVGVMPRTFEFPSRDTRLWLTERVIQAFEVGPTGVNAHIRLHNAVARLKPG